MSHGDFEEAVGSSWKVELDGKVNFDLVGSELERNVLATGVDVCVHNSMSQLPCSKVISFFEVLASSLGRLKRLECYPGAGSYNSFPIKALLPTVRESNKLEVLYVYHLELFGDVTEFKAFAEQLGQCQSLKEVCFIDCRLSSNSVRAFDPVVRSLGCLKSLQVVALWADDLGQLSSHSLAKLCRSNSIERLMLLGFDLDDQDISVVFHEVSLNRSLRRLNVSCSFMGSTGCKCLCRMLHRNAKLEKLQIDFDVLEHDRDLMEVAAGLKMNSTLNYLKMSGSTLGKGNLDLQQSFESMLEINRCLRTLSILDGEVCSPTMDLYLKLNSCGRRKVFETALTERGPWMDALANSNGDINCLFYFLSVTDHVASAVYSVQ